MEVVILKGSYSFPGNYYFWYFVSCHLEFYSGLDFLFGLSKVEYNFIYTLTHTSCTILLLSYLNLILTYMNLIYSIDDLEKDDNSQTCLERVGDNSFI